MYIIGTDTSYNGLIGANVRCILRTIYRTKLFYISKNKARENMHVLYMQGRICVLALTNWNYCFIYISTAGTSNLEQSHYGQFYKYRQLLLWYE
jgi:hypothetical protein